MGRRGKAYVQKWDRWEGLQGWEVFRGEAAYLERKAEQGWWSVGVVGFAGSWSRSGLRGEALGELERQARGSMERALGDLRQAHGEKLLMVSGGTKAGVLEVAYEVCASQGILAMTLTSDQGLGFAQAEANYCLPVGRRFGEESGAFLRGIDALLVMGGGAQSAREVEMALERGLPLVVLRGFGGAADALGEEVLGEAKVY